MTSKVVDTIRQFARRHPIYTGAGGGVLLFVGACLIGRQLFDGPPDAATADLHAAVAFVSSDRFASLDSLDRDAYLRKLGARYLKESPDNKRLLGSVLGTSVARPLQRELGLAMVRSMLSEYHTLTSEQRRSRIQSLRLFAGAMRFTSRTAQALDPGKNPLSGSLASEETFKKGLAEFERDLLLGLSAEERAKLRAVADDVRGR